MLDTSHTLFGVGHKWLKVYHGGLEHGTYNHAAMIDYHNGVFLLAWKNGPFSEDKDGQRIIFSQSTDGKNWSKISDDRDYSKERERLR